METKNVFSFSYSQMSLIIKTSATAQMQTYNLRKQIILLIIKLDSCKYAANAAILKEIGSGATEQSLFLCALFEVFTVWYLFRFLEKLNV